MEKIILLLDDCSAHTQMPEDLASALNGMATVHCVIGDEENRILAAIATESPGILIDGRMRCSETKPAAWRLRAQHLFAVGMSRGPVPYGEPWNLFAVFNGNPETRLQVYTPEGGEIGCGSLAAFAKFIWRRAHVTWTRSVRIDDGCLTDPDAHERAVGLLAFAQDAHLFTDKNGNCSWRGREADTLVVTPRQAVKADCLPNDLVIAKHDPARRTLEYASPRKPSIDASVQAALYAALPWICGLLHIHPQAGLILPDTTTDFPYPCGAQEEASAILHSLRHPDRKDAPFIVELVHHGYLIGVEDGGAHRLLEEWRHASIAYQSHLVSIGKQDLIRSLTLQPIMAEARIIGVLATDARKSWGSCYLLRSERGRGFGRRLLEPLARRRLNVRAHVRCGVSEFYQSHGWTVTEQDTEFTTLAPPKTISGMDGETEMLQCVL